MKFELDDKVVQFLAQKGSTNVTLDVEDLDTTCCLGRVPEMKITLVPPSEAHQSKYRHFNHAGINLYLSKLIRSQETLTLHLSGFGPFKKLEASGINLVL
ncbi:MAG: hypothetical protein G3M70_01090 [Candidatus Nitronauta litoralis]|uniref:Uncharacterized protein n=1 Tax=Candidatus Nitronauta litoralis TaxID=2705533 RepID=A0A7T0FYY4_9BACT|nr:MAG: hypothetical protein G3M70_01090 [Candidatus Nitronauta litoralis]